MVNGLVVRELFVKLYDSTSDSLMSLLTSVKSCKVQLPDFQRGRVWDDERIRKLKFTT